MRGLQPWPGHYFKSVGHFAQEYIPQSGRAGIAYRTLR
jgi:hypothetical protein